MKNMIGGAKPNKIDRRDRDFHKTFGTIGAYPTFPENYITDTGLWRPSQNAYEPVFNNQPLPYGCTSYSSADVYNDMEEKLLGNPMTLEKVTNASARGGIDIREALKACLPKDSLHPNRIGWFDAFYNVKAYQPLDYFDAFRYAQMSGVPEKRSISWGCPWFLSWQNAIYGNISTKNPDGSYYTTGGGERKIIMPMPTDEEFEQIKKDPNSMLWHNSVLCGWKTINGVPYYIDKSWQGKDIGDNGLIYFPREVINRVMAINGTVAYTASNIAFDEVKTIDTTPFQWIFSFIRTFLGLRY